MDRMERPMIAVASTFVVGLVGTVLVGTLVAAGRSDTVGATTLAVCGIGALCAVIGTAARSRPEALLAGLVGLVVAVVYLQSGHTTDFGTALISIILAFPYLAGFGAVTLVTALLPSEPRPTP